MTKHRTMGRLWFYGSLLFAAGWKMGKIHEQMASVTKDCYGDNR